MDGDGYTTCLGDCDDSDGDVNPAATEAACDDVDNDCDGSLHADEVDDDADDDVADDDAVSPADDDTDETGGCGCRSVGDGGSGAGGLLAISALSLLRGLGRRRRR